MNATTQKKELTKRYIGLLDVYGFEFFEVNSFEPKPSPSPKPNPKPNPSSNPNPSPNPSPNPTLFEVSSFEQPCINSLYLPISPHISPYLPISP